MTQARAPVQGWPSTWCGPCVARQFGGRTPYVVSGRAVEAGTAMSIKFVDEEPEGAGKAKNADAPPAKREPDAEGLEVSVESDLTHPKPAPTERGRKKPLK